MRVKKFRVTDEHLVLLRGMYIGWNDCEFGAPAVDCKRPYGNSDVVGDIVEMLGWATPEQKADEDFYARDHYTDEANKIHAEMQTVLQILVSSLSIEPGHYETSGPYSHDWSLV